MIWIQPGNISETISGKFEHSEEKLRLRVTELERDREQRASSPGPTTSEPYAQWRGRGTLEFLQWTLITIPPKKQNTRTRPDIQSGKP